MNKFFYYNSLCLGSNTQSVFSIDPYVTAIRELMLSELKQIVFYIEKLRNLDFDMTSYTDKVIEFITVIIVNLDFNKENTFVIIEDLYNNKKVLEKMYISACERMGITPELFRNSKNLSDKNTIIKALNDKEENIKSKDSNINMTKTRKYLYEIMLNIVLNACNRLIELKAVSLNKEEAKNEVLKFLNTANIPSLTDEELKLAITNFSKTSYETTKYLYDNLMKKYGPVSKTKVNVCEKEGKAILVSGTGYKELEEILNSTEGLNIYVYSYHEMISAFQYEKFKKHPNFAGHYNKCTNSIQSDFASFPGPVYVTKNYMPKIDVIRGRVYTGTKYPAFGISRIDNNNYEPLIQSALDTEGFTKDYVYKEIEIGFDERKISDSINEIIEKFRNKEINNIIIIGLADKFNFSDEYLSQFLELNHENNYIISFAFNKDRTNFINVNSYLDFGILYNIIEKLVKKEKSIKDNISVFLADCNNRTISHIFNLIHLEVKNIFLGECCPNVVSPVLIEGLEKIFNIRPFTNPEDDLAIINNGG